MPLTFPLRHISIRVPWHDAKWDGSVCLDPLRNSACLKLNAIAEHKDEDAEAVLVGRRFEDLNWAQVPPCLKERGAFMSPRPIPIEYDHPYRLTQPDEFGRFRPTIVSHPAYSAPGLPFRWMVKGEYDTLKRQHPLESVDEAWEPDLGFQSAWWQDYRNHAALLEAFWEYVKPEESLVFFYAKQVPLLEEMPSRRVLVGVGRVKSVGSRNEYLYAGSPDGKQRSLIWERMVSHSIRPRMTDGFLLPYHEALAKCVDGNAFNPAEVVAITPEGRFTEFSYATEHVSDDAAIEALQSIRSALLKSAELFGADIKTQEDWIDRELGRLWTKRGPFPGMGAVLSASGVPMGNFIAREVSEQAGDDKSPWDAWFSSLSDPAANFPPELAGHIDPTLAKSWQRMPAERREFTELLSRVDLTTDQANMLVTPEVRKSIGAEVDDNGFLANPYLLYEATRLTSIPVPVGLVDRGVFLSPSKLGKFPPPEQSRISTPVDERRLRALTIRGLEEAAVMGHTLLPREDIVLGLRKGDEAIGEQETLVTEDTLGVAEKDTFPGEVRIVEMSDGKPAYQLERLGRAGERIRTIVRQRKGGKRHNIRANWRAELERALDEAPDPEEEQAREEKARALEEIANARFSVLTGSAGTGKSTLLSVLCKNPEIQEGGIALLVPTGKARVRMEDIARKAGIHNFKAYTLAQFLMRFQRYNPETQRYTLDGKPKEAIAKNVIVDECSMLTEEMLAALIESLTGMERLILVGDHRQLPPIGAGRPFADIVAELRPAVTGFPVVGTSYAELTIPRRQAAGDRDAADLAVWFGGEPTPGHDRILEVFTGQRESSTVKVVYWETADDLTSKLTRVLSEQLGFDPTVDDSLEFARSLGGEINGAYAYFNRGRSGAMAEKWQILTPSRHKPEGVEALNRFIHRIYRAEQVASATHTPVGQRRRSLKPQGDQLIVYGDKVINNRNRRLKDGEVYPGQADPYLANGEIGVVVGQIRTQNFNYEPRYLEVEFSTQQGHVVKFWPSAFSQEQDSGLELAYALTVHKAQGSEFETVFLVLPSSPKYLLSRELIYTALTRQTKRLVLLVQGAPADMLALSSEQRSDTASRLTNLFAPPTRVQILQNSDKFFEERLIHRTERGDAVRSKSEVIVANLLRAKGVDYRYEEPLKIGESVKYPDFTIEDDNTGETYYWEHLGMLSLPAYREAWDEKLRWYERHGILPREQGGGERGTLIVTEDSADGGIDSEAVARLIDDLFGA